MKNLITLFLIFSTPLFAADGLIVLSEAIGEHDIADPSEKVSLFFEIIQQILDGIQSIIAHPFVQGFFIGGATGGALGFKKVRAGILDGVKKVNPMKKK